MYEDEFLWSTCLECGGEIWGPASLNDDGFLCDNCMEDED